ncbi:MAG: hypothetical protein CEN92_479, partial [Candidatus Berkelbacteria bacterium Licking1014_96]
INKVKKLEQKPTLFDVLADGKPVLHLRISQNGSREDLQKIKEILSFSAGESAVVLHLPEAGQFKQVRITSKVKIDEDLLARLKALLGKDSVKVKEKTLVS